MPRPREVQRLQPWSGWGGSFRGALPGGPGWGPHRLHPILRLLLSGRDCSGGDHNYKAAHGTFLVVSVEKPACQCREHRFNPWWEKIPDRKSVV